MYVQLIHDPRPMRLRGSDADVEKARNIFRSLAFGDQLKDLALARGQLTVARDGFVQIGFDDRAGNRRTQIDSAVEDITDSLHQVRRSLSLDNIAVNSRSKSLEDVRVLPVHRQKQRAGPRRLPLDFSSGIQTVEQRHGKVEDRNIGLKFTRKPDCLMAIVGLTDYATVAFQFQQGL